MSSCPFTTERLTEEGVLQRVASGKDHATRECNCGLAELRFIACDANMYHMKRASVRDLRYNFPQIEAQLRRGEEIQITKRKRVIARLLPVRPPARKSAPDFMKMLRDIYGDKLMKTAGADLVSEQRGRF